MIARLAATLLLSAAMAGCLGAADDETAAAAAGVPPAGALRILCYHDVSDALASYTDVSTGALDAQLRELVAMGARTLGMDELYAIRTGAMAAPPRAVVITFDDGYAGDDAQAVPLLRRYGLKATFFVYTDAVGLVTDRDHMTWDELRAIDQDPLFEVQSHTRSHPWLTQLSDAALEEELRGSRAAIERELGGTHDVLAYPFGDRDPRVVAAARSVYRMALSVEGGTDPLFEIPRLAVGRGQERGASFRKMVQDDGPALAVGEVVIDDASSLTVLEGAWRESHSVPGGLGGSYSVATCGSGTLARVRLPVVADGNFQLWERHTSGTNRGTVRASLLQAPAGPARELAAIDQSAGGGSWQPLGTYWLAPGAELTLDAGACVGVAVMDGVRITKSPW